MPVDPFTIQDQDIVSGSLARRAMGPLLSWVLQLDTYRQLYADTLGSSASQPFDARAMAALGISVVCSTEESRHVPSTGPLVVAANHPHGLLDGLALLQVIRHTRRDVRVLTNRVLSRVPELDAVCFYVDPFDGPDAAARSRAGLRAARRWLQGGSALIVFPAGEVAHRGQYADGTRQDSAWHATAFRLARTAGATIVPAFIAGTNSPLFYAAGHLHPACRTLLLARELLAKRGEQITVRIGAPLSTTPPHQHATSADALSSAIKHAVEQLVPAASRQPVVLSSADAVAWDIAKLPTSACLVASGEFQVFVATARQIPAALAEIGRLRECTYRAIGEGTGRTLDLDTFDEDYLHLFLWDRARRVIVGAYRIGQTDRVTAERGVEGLYTRTLFRYDERLIARLSPALELGRAFVRAEYQKDFSPLLLLWKGIGQFVVQHPRYRVLFGPVSISARYSDSSHNLLMAFLEQNHRDHDLAELVRAVNPAQPRSAASTTVPKKLEETNALVAQSEADGKGVPVLLRQYLKLNARLLGFNVDPDFGDALDALMMVDLTNVAPGILHRYLGRTGADAFLAHHQRKSASAA